MWTPEGGRRAAVTCANAAAVQGACLPQRRFAGQQLGAGEVLQVGHADHHAPAGRVLGRGFAGGRLLHRQSPRTQQHPARSAAGRAATPHPTAAALTAQHAPAKRAPQGGGRCPRPRTPRKSPQHGAGAGAGDARSTASGEEVGTGLGTAETGGGGAPGREQRARRPGAQKRAGRCVRLPDGTTLRPDGTTPRARLHPEPRAPPRRQVPVLLGLRAQVRLGKGVHPSVEPGFKKRTKHVGIQHLEETTAVAYWDTHSPACATGAAAGAPSAPPRPRASHGFPTRPPEGTRPAARLESHATARATHSALLLRTAAAAVRVWSPARGTPWHRAPCRAPIHLLLTPPPGARCPRPLASGLKRSHPAPPR